MTGADTTATRARIVAETRIESVKAPAPSCQRHGKWSEDHQLAARVQRGPPPPPSPPPSKPRLTVASDGEGEADDRDEEDGSNFDRSFYLAEEGQLQGARRPSWATRTS